MTIVFCVNVSGLDDRNTFSVFSTRAKAAAFVDRCLRRHYAEEAEYGQLDAICYAEFRAQGSVNKLRPDLTHDDLHRLNELCKDDDDVRGLAWDVKCVVVDSHEPIDCF